MSERPVEIEEERVRRGPKHGDDSGELNINSLMDIMTILLVFLILSITSDPLNVKQGDDLLLAKSTVNENSPTDSIAITLNKRHIIVDNQATVKVDCKIGGQICTEEDFAEKSRCNNPKETCSLDEMARYDAMRFYIDKSFKEDGNDSKFLITPLHKELERLVKSQKEENASLGRPFEGSVTIIADRDIPYRLIAETVYSAGMAELHDLRFAIVKTSAR